MGMKLTNVHRMCFLGKDRLKALVIYSYRAALILIFIFSLSLILLQRRCFVQRFLDKEAGIVCRKANSAKTSFIKGYLSC